MEYTVHALAALSGVSRRTLHYYDSIGLLRPARIAENGYRMYGAAEIDRLQQILLYRAFGMELAGIREILDNPAFDAQAALEQHLHALLERKASLELQISSVRKTIQAKKGECTMKDTEKFEGFRTRMLAENEEKYGGELRRKYGDDAVDASIFKVCGMAEADWQAAETLRERAEALFREAMPAGAPACEAAQQACAVHGEWLRRFWKSGTYTKAAHAALGAAYAGDARFAAYYETHVGPGAAAFIRDALAIYAENAKAEN